jgi:D-alanyl-D-alanine carboxypeptidase
MTRPLLAVLLILGHLPVAAAARRRAVQHPSAPVAPPAIVAAARQAAEIALKAGAPAVQVAVSERGRVLYAEAFGMADRESATAATPRSVVQVGSITKQFAAAAILRLAERGALSLDDRIEKHVPEYDPPATITLRHLLTHTSGLTALPASEYTPQTRESFLELIDGQPLAFTPGTKFSYSNAGYKLLGYAIESVSGKSFADFVHTEFALPLGLIDTGVCGTSSVPLPDGYGVGQGSSMRIRAIEMSVPFSAGALCSTASDLVRWSHLLATGRVLLADSYASMTTPASLPPNTIAPPYGLGVFLQNQLGHRAVWHTGGIPGFQSSLLYFRDEDIAVAVIVNALPFPAGADAHLIALEVARAALATP